MDEDSDGQEDFSLEAMQRFLAGLTPEQEHEMVQCNMQAIFEAEAAMQPGIRRLIWDEAPNRDVPTLLNRASATVVLGLKVLRNLLLIAGGEADLTEEVVHGVLGFAHNQVCGTAAAAKQELDDNL